MHSFCQIWTESHPGGKVVSAIIIFVFLLTLVFTGILILMSSLPNCARRVVITLHDHDLYKCLYKNTQSWKGSRRCELSGNWTCIALLMKALRLDLLIPCGLYWWAHNPFCLNFPAPSRVHVMPCWQTWPLISTYPSSYPPTYFRSFIHGRWLKHNFCLGTP